MPRQRVNLSLYVSTMNSVVSEALAIEKETTQIDRITKQQYPVFFV
jgi:hypothetical protein